MHVTPPAKVPLSFPTGLGHGSRWCQSWSQEWGSVNPSTAQWGPCPGGGSSSPPLLHPMLAFLRHWALLAGCLSAPQAWGQHQPCQSQAVSSLLPCGHVREVCVDRVVRDVHPRWPGWESSHLEGLVLVACGPGLRIRRPPRCLLLTQGPSRWGAHPPNRPGRTEVGDSWSGEGVHAGPPGCFPLRLRPGLGASGAMGWAGVLGRVSRPACPSLCSYWFSLKVPITQASCGHRDRNKSRKAAQPEAGNPIPPQRPEGAPAQGVPGRGGPHAARGHGYSHAHAVHTRIRTCIGPHRRLPPADSGHANTHTHRHTPGHTPNRPQGAGERAGRRAAPEQLRGRVASWERGPTAARASEFLRETGKLNFYVKYPDF